MTPHNSDAGLPDGKGLEVVGYAIPESDQFMWNPGCPPFARAWRAVVYADDATARVAASQAEIAHITASRDEWAEECGFRLAERDEAVSQLRGYKKLYRDAVLAREVIEKHRDEISIERDDARAQVRDWLRENGPGGWIDGLRVREKALREALKLAEFAMDDCPMVSRQLIDAIKACRAALNPPPAAGDSAAATQESST